MRILITAGGTREYIDPVRFIANASSGKMGYALARAALKAGHKVTLVSASDLQPPVGIDFVGVESADDMFKMIKRHFPRCDCLIMAAAVADYTPARPAKTKIKRTGKSLTIKLKPTADILKWAGKHKRKNQVVIGFALADKDLRRNAEKKLKDKHLDKIIANTPDAIGSDKSTVHIKTPCSGWITNANIDKSVSALKIIHMLENL
jgi:phosphopantothenoylcysteine decarboxylase/phosphopantothenate--cysteine ligase